MDENEEDGDDLANDGGRSLHGRLLGLLLDGGASSGSGGSDVGGSRALGGGGAGNSGTRLRRR